MTPRPISAPPHERTNRGWRGVKDRDAVPLDDLPETILLRPIRGAFVHHDRRAVSERPIHHVTVSGDPTDVRRTPVDVVLLEIEHPLRRRVGADQISASGVNDSFRFSG